MKPLFFSFFFYLSDVVCKALIWNVDINFTTSFESKLENRGIKLLKDSSWNMWHKGYYTIIPE